MKEHQFQEDLEIIEAEEEVDFFDESTYRSPYYHDDAYPEFYGWRDLVL